MTRSETANQDDEFSGRLGMLPSLDINAFLDGWHGVAATAIDRHLNILGTSPLAEALFPNLRPGVNLAREVFLGFGPGEAPTTCARDMSGQVVAVLQASLHASEEDDEFRRVVGELSTMSRDFSTAWADETTELVPHGIIRATHPVIGDISIRYQLLELAAGRNDLLIVWQGADPASESALGRLVLAI